MNADDPITCYVTPEGEVICTGSSIVDYQGQTTSQQRLNRMSAAVASWGPNKAELFLKIFDVLNESSLSDSPNIPRRTPQIVASVNQLLQPEPPSILLYNYSTQPGSVMGNFFINKGEVMRMHAIAKQFETIVPG